MSAHQRKVIRDHARRNGHLVDLWDASDFRWYAKFKYRAAAA
jgi:hypothetical protein